VLKIPAIAKPQTVGRNKKRYPAILITMIKNGIIILFSCIVLTSCYNTLLPIRIPTSSPRIPDNSIKKEIPRYTNNKLFKYYKFTKQKQKQLDLSIPENGFDSLQFRLWFTYPENLYQFGELIELNYKKGQEPVAKYYKLDIFFNPTREYEVINRVKDTTIINPKNGWVDFTNKLMDLKIIELPTISDIKVFQDSVMLDDLFNNTSLTVVTEISTDSYYRYFEYNNFDKYQNIDEVSRMYQFIKYIRENLYMYPIDSNWYKE
jgi:hypothetical protein